MRSAAAAQVEESLRALLQQRPGPGSGGAEPAAPVPAVEDLRRLVADGEATAAVALAANAGAALPDGAWDDLVVDVATAGGLVAEDAGDDGMARATAWHRLGAAERQEAVTAAELVLSLSGAMRGAGPDLALGPDAMCALLMAHGVLGNADELREEWEGVVERDLVPRHSRLYSAVMRALSVQRNGEDILALARSLIERDGMVEQLESSAAAALAAAERPDLLEELLELRPPAHAAPYLSLIRALWEARRPDDVAAVWDGLMLRGNVKWTPRTHTTAVTLLGRAGDAARMAQAYEIGWGIAPEPNPYAVSAAVMAYGRMGETDRVRQTFVDAAERGMPVDIVVFNSMLSALADAGDESATEVVVDQIHAHGLRPNADTFAAHIKVVALARNRDRLLEVWELAAADPGSVNEAVLRRMVDGLAGCRDYRSARRVVAESFERGWVAPSAGVLNQLMHVHAHGCAEKEAFKPVKIRTEKPLVNSRAWRGMMEVFDWFGRYGVRADSSSFAALLDASLVSGQADEVPRILDAMEERGVPVDRHVYARLFRLWRESPVRPDAPPIMAYRQMLEEGVVPDRNMLDSLMHLVRRWGRPAEARELWRGVLRFRVTPDIRLWRSALQMFMFHGSCAEAADLMERCARPTLDMARIFALKLPTKGGRRESTLELLAGMYGDRLPASRNEYTGDVRAAAESTRMTADELARFRAHVRGLRLINTRLAVFDLARHLRLNPNLPNAMRSYRELVRGGASPNRSLVTLLLVWSRAHGTQADTLTLFNDALVLGIPFDERLVNVALNAMRRHGAHKSSTRLLAAARTGVTPNTLRFFAKGLPPEASDRVLDFLETRYGDDFADVEAREADEAKRTADARDVPRRTMLAFCKFIDTLQLQDRQWRPEVRGGFADLAAKDGGEEYEAAEPDPRAPATTSEFEFRINYEFDETRGGPALKAYRESEARAFNNHMRIVDVDDDDGDLSMMRFDNELAK